MNIKQFKDVYKAVDSVTILLTNDCNLHCDYCFETNKGKDYIMKETAEEILRRTYRKLDSNQYGENKFTVNMFGGEPMLAWPVIKHLCDVANKEYMIVSFGITTNMTIMTDEMLDYIDDNDIFMLTSVDGNKFAHDAHRCGSYDVVIKNIKKLIDRGLSHLIEIRMTVTPETAKYMKDSIKMFIDMGINNICPVAATDVEWSDEAIEELRKAYTDTLNMYVDILNDDSNKRNISIRKVDEALNSVLSPNGDYNKMCNIASTRWVVVDWNGDVWPCPDFPTTDNKELQKLKIGNFFTGVDVDKIRTEPMKAKFNMEKCKNCPAKFSCKSGCPYQNFYNQGNFFTPTDAYCKLEVMYYEEIQKFRDKLLESTNIRSRELNVLIENLKVKDYFDNVLKESNPYDKAFLFKLNHFTDMVKNIEINGNLLPSFRDYFNEDISKIFAIITAVAGVEIKQKTEERNEANADKC